MDNEVALEYEPTRFYTILVAAFSSSALALTSLGLFALLSHAAARRTAEMGLRLALGALRSSAAWLLGLKSTALTSVETVVVAAAPRPTHRTTATASPGARRRLRTAWVSGGQHRCHMLRANECTPDARRCAGRSDRPGPPTGLILAASRHSGLGSRQFRTGIVRVRTRA
jgi:hypothetical protein